MSNSHISPMRRVLLLGILAAAPIPLWANALSATPRQTPGPFYPRNPRELPLDDDNDLTRIAGRAGVARGRVTELLGRVVDTNGRPLPRTRVEIWQCDANGRYHHPRDRRDAPLDPNFQGHGHTVTDAQGNYLFRTIRPVPYPGRTPHIHAALFPAGGEPLVTQIYVEGEPRNAGDFLFNRVPAEKRSRVLATFQPVDRPNVELEARFDVVIGGTPGEEQRSS